jgi:hypothetical protein
VKITSIYFLQSESDDTLVDCIVEWREVEGDGKLLWRPLWNFFYYCKSLW